jgi:hypothetical protein
MGYPTRTSSVRVCHFATSAGRPRISLEPDLSLKFSLKNGMGADLASRPVSSVNRLSKIALGVGFRQKETREATGICGISRHDQTFFMLRSAIIFFSLLTIPLRANLGETVEQCVARYGKPVGYSEAGTKFPFGTLVFAAGGYTLIVFLFHNKEVGARVSKLDKSAFTDAEMKNIMSADSAGSSWTPAPSDDPTCLQWIRGDKATVLYDKQKHMLIFTSQEMVQVIHAPPAKPAAPPASPVP